MRTGSNTKWGRAQHVRTLLPGVWMVETAGHGGIVLTESYNKLIPEGARRDDGCYEEDCDWAIPAACFSEIRTRFSFSETGVRQCLRAWNPEALDVLDKAGIFLKEGEAA